MNRDELTIELATLLRNDQMVPVLELIDKYVATLVPDTDGLWTYADAKDHLGLPSESHARRLLSFWKVRKVTSRPHPVSGKLQSLFDPKAVWAEVKERDWVYIPRPYSSTRVPTGRPKKKEAR